MSQHTEWRLQFETDRPETLVTGNERCRRLDDGRCEHTITLPFREEQYRKFAAKAERLGAADIRLSRRVRTAAAAYGEWGPVDAPEATL